MTVTRTRTAGLILLVSVPAWWLGLRAWATHQYGYLDLDATGSSPLVWAGLISIAGVLLTLGVSHKPGGSIGRNMALAAFLLVAGYLAADNAIGGVGNGISGPGMVLGGLSVAQVAIVIIGITHRPREMRDPAVAAAQH